MNKYDLHNEQHQYILLLLLFYYYDQDATPQTLPPAMESAESVSRPDDIFSHAIVRSAGWNPQTSADERAIVQAYNQGDGIGYVPLLHESYARRVDGP